MWVSRIRVTGGFLSGLDLRLHPGLNVIIGPRGVGKTSLLELIRHALGISNAQIGGATRRLDLIVSILGAGEVIIDLETGSSLEANNTAEQLIVDGSGKGRRQEFSASALMIGQNELESIASDPESRLKLIDLRADVSAAPTPAPEVAVLTHRLFGLREEVNLLTDQLRARSNLLKDREGLAAIEAELMGRASSELTKVRAELTHVENEMRQLRQDEESADQLLQDLNSSSLEVLALRGRFEGNAARAVSNRVAADIRPGIERVRLLLGDARSTIQQLRSTLSRSIEQMSEAEIELQAQATPLRSALEESEKGLGEVTARLRNIDLQLARLDTAADRLRESRALSIAVSSERSALLDEFELAQERRYTSRTQVAELVSARLSNRVVITIEHLTNSQAYRDLLVRLLQGSGIQFRSPAEAISRATLPRQLVEMIESGQHSKLALLTGLPESRVAKALAHLEDPQALSDIASMNIEDAADFLLRVGSELKSVSSLSTGQKCAVTLPIFLTEHTKPLILDQPEDHLDNAYLVSTVVRSVRARVAAGAQTIIATHNANVPVLADADVVASLNSDGRRGYIAHAGHVDEPAIVRAITDVMEGGLAAFRARAEFYDQYGAES